MYIFTVFLEVVLWAGLLFGIACDLMSCRLSIRRRRLGSGPSAIPVVGWMLYVLRISVRPIDMLNQIHRSWGFIVAAIFVATVFHALCQWFIPRMAAPATASRRK